MGIVVAGAIVYYAAMNDYLGWIWSPFTGWYHAEWFEEMIVSSMIWGLRQIVNMVLSRNEIITVLCTLRTIGLSM